MQVHGGVGFIEETGAAQHMRDARILTIYEGTTRIQADDLLGRKLLRDGGEGLTLLVREMDADLARLEASEGAGVAAFRPRLEACLNAFERSAWKLIEVGKTDL